MIRKFLDWLLRPTPPPSSVNRTKDRSLAGKVRVKARRMAAEQIRRHL